MCSSRKKGESYLLVEKKITYYKLQSLEITGTFKFVFSLEFVISNGRSNSAVTSEPGEHRKLNVTYLNIAW